MRVLFTRSNLLGSKIIRSLTGEDISHVALEMDGIVIHARFDGVEIEGLPHFLEHNEIVRAYSVVGDNRKRFWEAMLLEGSKYDYKAFFSIGLRLILRKSLGIVIPSLSDWAIRRQYICTEFVDTILHICNTGGDTITESNRHITPGELEAELRDRPDITEIRS